MARSTRIARGGGSTRRTPAAIKLTSKEGPVATSWVRPALDAVLRVAHRSAHCRPGCRSRPGNPSVRRLDIGHGSVVAFLHGRGEPKRTVTINLTTYDHEHWEKLARTMADQSLFAAKLLAGDMPRDVEDLFAPLGLKLLPDGAGRGADEGDGPAARPGERRFPGCPAASLRSSPSGWTPIRSCCSTCVGSKRTSSANASASAAPSPAPPRASPRPTPPSRSTPPRPPPSRWRCSWPTSGPRARGSTSSRRRWPGPRSATPILRRLGPSPFSLGKFPLVGLLATCYDTISESAIKGQTEPEQGLDEDHVGDPRTGLTGPPAPLHFGALH